MSSRVHKTASLYMERKPEIDRIREFKSHTRAARRHALRLKQVSSVMQSIRDSLPNMKRAELKTLCAQFEIKGRSTMTKGQMIKALESRL